MRIPLAPAGWREMGLITLIFGGAAVGAACLGLGGSAIWWPVAGLLAVGWPVSYTHLGA